MILFKNNMKKEIKMVICSMILILVMSGVYITYDSYLTTTWHKKEIGGYVREYKLYNDFPNIELFIYFTDASYLHVTRNPFWTYSQIINIDISKKITINYEINEKDSIKVIDVNGFYYKDKAQQGVN